MKHTFITQSQDSKKCKCPVCQLAESAVTGKPSKDAWAAAFKEAEDLGISVTEQAVEMVSELHDDIVAEIMDGLNDTLSSSLGRLLKASNLAEAGTQIELSKALDYLERCVRAGAPMVKAEHTPAHHVYVKGNGKVH